MKNNNDAKRGVYFTPLLKTSIGKTSMFWSNL